MLRVEKNKERVAELFGRTGLSSRMLRAHPLLYGRHARAINYHDVPAAETLLFRAQIEWFAKHFRDVGPEQLAAILAGHFESDRPGILISFDDGLRSAAEVVAPVLEEFGFTGWFMVPPKFVDTPVDRQAEFALENSIDYRDRHQDGRVAMTWHQVRKLSQRHVITCHGMTHRRLSAQLTPAELDYEIRASKNLLEDRLGRPIDAFTWIGGEEASYSAEAARTIRESGYRYAFMTNNLPINKGSDPLQLQRTNVESWFSGHRVLFQFSGLPDVLYFAKRRRVNALSGRSREASPAIASGLW